MSSTLDAVIDAALERALLDTSDARRYFALAGALDRVWAPEAVDGADTSQRGYYPSEDEWTGDTEDRPLRAALVTTVAIGALGSTTLDGIDPEAWSPGHEGVDTRLVAAGAAAACRRFDVEAEQVAVRSGVPRDRLQRYRGESEHGSGR